MMEPSSSRPCCAAGVAGVGTRPARVSRKSETSPSGDLVGVYGVQAVSMRNSGTGDEHGSFATVGASDGASLAHLIDLIVNPDVCCAASESIEITASSDARENAS